MSFREFCIQNEIAFKTDEPMSNHTSFKIGGNADYFIECEDVRQLKKIICECKQSGIPYFVLGKGSNILVSNKGINGVVLSLGGFNKVCLKEQTVQSGAGVSLARLCNFALDNSLSGMEFAYGIPGSVGGALYMNAGAYGGEMSQVVLSAEVMDKNGNIYEIGSSDMQMGYRTSVFKTDDFIILSARFKLKSGNVSEIKSAMDTYMLKRKEKQPLEYPSAGSTFKRPKGNFAGALIEKNGLKGMSVGGAKVSEKHAGFVVNYNNATADDVKSLMGKIVGIVKKNDGITLEPEVIFVGRE